MAHVALDVRRVEVQGDRGAGIKVGKGLLMNLTQRLFELANVAEREAAQERSCGLGSGNRKTSQRLLDLVASGNLQVIEAVGTHGDRLGDGQDRLRLAQPSQPLLQVDMLFDVPRPNQPLGRSLGSKRRLLAR